MNNVKKTLRKTYIFEKNTCGDLWHGAQGEESCTLGANEVFVSESKFSSEDPYVCTYDVCENSETAYCALGELNTFLQHYNTETKMYFVNNPVVQL